MKVANCHPASKARKTTKASVEIVIYERPAGATEPGMTGNISAAAAARNGELPTRPAMNITMVENHFDARWLTRKRDHVFGRNEAHLLPDNALDQFSAWSDEKCDLHWLDLTTGAAGKGTITLTMHVLKVGANEAAFRMAALTIARRYNGKTIDFFTMPTAA